MNYTWQGEPILDIHAWCRERGEQMVRVRKTWTEPMVFSGVIADREEIIEMPAVFFRSMRFGGPRDEQYHEIDRYDP